MRIANLIFLVAFLLSAAVQFNDPDPLRWILLYSGISIACVLFHFNKLLWYYVAAISVFCIVWAIALVPALSDGIPWSEIADSLAMRSDAVEEARELGGLLFVLSWSLILTWLSFKSKSQEP